MAQLVKKQRYGCKDCLKQSLTRYSYRAYLSDTKSLLIKMTLNGSGIWDIFRVLGISTNTVGTLILAKSAKVTEPRVPKRLRNLEMDEFWSKKREATADLVCLGPKAKKVLAFQNGRRTDENCKLLIDKLKDCGVRNYHRDAGEVYQKYLPAESHFIGKYETVNIERNKLNFRTHLKRLEGRTICFSRSDEMHDGVIKIYDWHSNLKQHHFGDIIEMERQSELIFMLPKLKK